MTTFWVLAPVMVIAALGLLFAKKAVHAALSLAIVMICLAMLYAVQDAPFLFAVQIIVYTGAIMMLFLFVLMLVGVDSADSLKETISGQRALAALVGVLFAILLALVVAQAVSSTVVGLDAATAAVPDGGNVEALAQLLFGRYVVAFQFTAALMITAVLGAMVLANRERLNPKVTQTDLSAVRMREYAEFGRHPGNNPTPGVFATNNAVDTPALLPDGSPLESSVTDILKARGQEQHLDAEGPAHTLEELESADFDLGGRDER
jgi:NADH-quinone oxidoreductase subunit J